MWTKEVPSLGNGYEYTLKSIAYLSAASNLGVKFLGSFVMDQPEMEKAYKIAQMNILAQKIAQKRVFCDILQFAQKQRISS